MGSNTSITSAMAKSVISGQTNINTIINSNNSSKEDGNHHSQQSHQELSKESQWSKSSPALKPTRPYRSSMKRSSRSVPNKMDEEFQIRVKQATSTAATNNAASNDSTPSPALSSTSSSSTTTTPTTTNSSEVQNVEDANKQVKSKSRPNAISYANFLNHSHTLTLADESIQDRYFDRYYPPLPADIEEKLKTVDKKARPKTANAYVKAKSASNLKISAPSNISITTESASPHNIDANNGNNNLVAKPMSPIVSLYSKNSPNNQSAPQRLLSRSNSHSFGLTSSNSSSSTSRHSSTSPTNQQANSLKAHPRPLQRSSSHSVGLTQNNSTSTSKSPTHSPSVSPRMGSSLQPHHAFQRTNSQSNGMLSPHHQPRSPSNSNLPHTFHKLTSEGTTIVG